MKQDTKLLAAAIGVLAAAIIIGAVLSNGIYQHTSGAGGAVFVINRLTGTTWRCVDECVRATEPPQEVATKKPEPAHTPALPTVLPKDFAGYPE
jgi:hypothetical protein